MGTNDENKLALDFMIVFSLFVVVPVGYVFDIYMLNGLYVEKTDISVWSAREGLGFCLLIFGPPLMHWLSYKYCQDNFGWFKKNNFKD